MKIAQLFILIIAFLVIKPVSAGVLIEPLLGYNLGSKIDFDGEDYSGGSGRAFGGRLGYQNLGFQLGVDYLNSTIDMDDNDFDDDVKLSEWGGFVGFEFPILLRVYAGYIFSATGETKNGDGVKTEMTDGSGAKFGVGFTGLPFVDINLEYRKGSFSEWEVGNVDGDGEVDYSSYMISISLPFVL